MNDTTDLKRRFEASHVTMNKSSERTTQFDPDRHRAGGSMLGRSAKVVV